MNKPSTYHHAIKTSRYGSNSSRSLARRLSSCLGLLLLAVSSDARAAVWSGDSADWTSNANPGWNGTGVPNAVGASALFNSASSANSTTTISTGQTVGTLEFGGSTEFSRIISVNNSRQLTLNQDGAGSGFATIINSNTSTSATNLLSIIPSSSSGQLTMADDLLISNTGGGTGANSILIATVIAGTGNLTFRNVSNNVNSGAIALRNASNTFTGSVRIEKGAVTVNNASSLGNVANLVTLGSTGNSASLVTTGSVTVAQKITVAATTGTNLLGSTSSNAADAVFSGTILLNGNLSVHSQKPSGYAVRLTNAVSGTGSLTTVGTGKVVLGDGVSTVANTYTGNTALTETSSFALADNASIKFVIGSSGVNNKMYGTANQVLILEGDFNFDLSGAAPVGSWTIVDVTTLDETFTSSFSVIGFSESANVWTTTVGEVTYTFSEASGILTAVPEPATPILVGLGLASVLIWRRRKATRPGLAIPLIG